VKVAIPAVTMAELLRSRAAHDGDSTALVDRERRVTYAVLK
jgi:hypothetical protein